MKLLTYIIFGILFLPFITYAQAKPKVERAYNCDAMLAIFDQVSRQASDSTNKDSYVIVVAYLGDGETSRRYNMQRLYPIETYLTRYQGIAKERLILTEGEKRKGLGKVEFYISGKLSNELFFAKRTRACSWCC
jgi:hypothetical protein